MSKQTAVEWLLLKICVLGASDGHGLNIDEIIDQAKAMEREQIRDAYYSSMLDYQSGKYKGGMAYYNETYKGGEQ